jgi:SCP-2 sterol transfer family
MPDPTDEFFDRVPGHHHPELVRFTGTVRFDISDESRVDHWLITVVGGTAQVARGEGQADMAIAADRALFNQILEAGGTEVFALYLGHKLKITGSPRMLFVFRALADARPGRHPRTVVDAKRSGHGE